MTIYEYLTDYWDDVGKDNRCMTFSYRPVPNADITVRP